MGGSEESKQKVDQVQAKTGRRGGSAFSEAEEPIMAFVRVEQRNAHLAGPVRLDYVTGRDGKVAKATLIAISNTRRGGEAKEEEATAIQWTLWGRQAENAAEFLDKGSHVNVVGRLRNNNYRDASGAEVFGYGFTCEEIDYLDSKAEAEARRQQTKQAKPVAVSTKPSRIAPSVIDPDDIPF
ncbi:MAG: single-stranded DNA-binding protein [Caldimonas sp.]